MSEETRINSGTKMETVSPLKALLEASANSPLSEADPRSLDELMQRAEIVFNTKPLELDNTDIATIVAYFRAKKSRFAQLAKEKADKDLAEPKRKRKSATSVSEALSLFNDQEIEI